ncbi:MAG: hypothetical protein C0476_11605 [Sphingomonas sp.]|nr:hypothetical protein [Sphingomonas sp.]
MLVSVAPTRSTSPAPIRQSSATAMPATGSASDSWAASPLARAATSIRSHASGWSPRRSAIAGSPA